MSLFRFGRTPRSPEGQPTLPDLRSIFDAHAEFLWKSLYRMGIAEADLPDVMQDVLIVLSRKLDQFDGSCKLTTFLYGICLRVAATARRTKQRRREDSADPEVHMANIACSSNPEMAVARMDARRRLQAAIDELTPEQRAVFVMYELEELSCAEIATELDIPKGTVFSRLHAARAEFKAAYERGELHSASLLAVGGSA